MHLFFFLRVSILTEGWKQTPPPQRRRKEPTFRFPTGSPSRLCFPVDPVRVCRGVGLDGPLQRRAGVLGRLLVEGGARVQKGRGFVGVEGPAVVFGSWRTRGPVVRHPPEVLEGAFRSLVVVGAEFVRTPSFGVWVSEEKGEFYHTRKLNWRRSNSQILKLNLYYLMKICLNSWFMCVFLLYA